MFEAKLMENIKQKCGRCIIWQEYNIIVLTEFLRSPLSFLYNGTQCEFTEHSAIKGTQKNSTFTGCSRKSCTNKQKLNKQKQNIFVISVKKQKNERPLSVPGLYMACTRRMSRQARAFPCGVMLVPSLSWPTPQSTRTT